MPGVLELPTQLAHLKYFIVRYDRNLGNYELIEPSRARTYNMGDAFATRAYFFRVGMEYLGGRAMDSAYAFGASQAIVKENRAFGLDLLKINLDAAVIKNERQLNDERIWGPQDDNENIQDIY